MQNSPLTTVALALFAALLLSGCSFSASSESISTSISSPFESSSSSSESSLSNQTRYENDVRDYTSAFVAAGGGAAGSFENGISAMAAERSITDWQSNPGTWVAVGRGLGDAELNEAQFLAYQESWTRGDPQAMVEVREGYDETR